MGRERPSSFPALALMCSRPFELHYYQNAAARKEFKEIIYELASGFHPTMARSYLNGTESFGVKSAVNVVDESVKHVWTNATALLRGFESIFYTNVAQTEAWYFAFMQLYTWIATGVVFPPDNAPRIALRAVAVVVSDDRCILAHCDETFPVRGCMRLIDAVLTADETMGLKMRVSLYTPEEIEFTPAGWFCEEVDGRRTLYRVFRANAVKHRPSQSSVRWVQLDNVPDGCFVPSHQKMARMVLSRN